MLTTLKHCRQVFASLDAERRPWFPHWQEVAEYFLPRRYPWLGKQGESATANRRNTKLLDSTSTLAVRTLASGMMSGITSPARKWFRLRVSGFSPEGMSDEAKLYLEEVQRRLLLLMAETNLYNALSVLYLEWCTFGTAAMTIYEDFDDVFRCYNHPLGEFYLGQDNTQRVQRFARRFEFTLEQMVLEFGLDALSKNLQMRYGKGDGQSRFEKYEVCHLIEANADDGMLPGSTSRWREMYWEAAAGDNDTYLRTTPLYEWPAITPRWELIGADSYGVSPAMDRL